MFPALLGNLSMSIGDAPSSGPLITGLAWIFLMPPIHLALVHIISPTWTLFGSAPLFNPTRLAPRNGV